MFALNFFPSPPSKAKTYNLVTCWLGTVSAREPNDNSVHKGSQEFEASLEFWCRNALTYDKATMGEPRQSSWAEVLGLKS